MADKITEQELDPDLRDKIDGMPTADINGIVNYNGALSIMGKYKIMYNESTNSLDFIYIG